MTRELLEAAAPQTQGEHHEEEDDQGPHRSEVGRGRREPLAQPAEDEVVGRLGWPKPVARSKEPKRLRQVSAKRAERIAAGEAPMKRGRIEYKPPRRLDGPGYDAGKESWTRAQDCVGLSFLPDHHCVGDNTFSHERDHTGMALKEASARGCCMCWWLHQQWTDAKTEDGGPWSEMSPEDRKRWMARRCDEFEAAWQALTEDQRTWWREVGAQREREAAI